MTDLEPLTWSRAENADTTGMVTNVTFRLKLTETGIVQSHSIEPEEGCLFMKAVPQGMWDRVRVTYGPRRRKTLISPGKHMYWPLHYEGHVVVLGQSNGCFRVWSEFYGTPPQAFIDALVALVNRIWYE